jgi:hypothetical protein
MIRATLLALIAVCYAAFHCPAANAPRVELDHVFVVVQPGAAAEVAALQSAGLTVALRVATHPGEGTASRAVFFENAYLELIWVDSSVAIDAEHASEARRFRDAAAWRTSGHSPFGFGLRRLPGDTAALPVPVKRESAEWLKPGTAYELLRQPGDAFAADFFVVPSSRSVPNWIASLRERCPDMLQHPGGGRKITRVRVYGPAKQHPIAFRALLPKPVEMVRAAKPLLELELDNGVRGERVDLRPVLPLVVVR